MYQKYIKRQLDLILASVLIILFLPLAAIIAVLIKLDSKGPVLYSQVRTGRLGELFRLYKFRSMALHNNVHDHTTENEITKVGRILRILSLDELPQLINILQGHMSFVGPRPWVPKYYELMSELQRTRTLVLPGITGRAQAFGRNGLHIFKKIEHDIEYVHNITFMNDLSIVIKTCKAVLDKEKQEIQKSEIYQELDILRSQSNSTELAE
jgi:undecaprenyl phosphate N,N'-diacetylbacillosamine 1-phosphate transferase